MDLLVIGFTITRILRWLTAPLFKLFFRNRSKKAPPIDDPLLCISAKELSRKIRQKELTSENVVNAYIKRIQQVDPTLCAVVEDRFNLALEEAKQTDELLKDDCINLEELERTKPLLGVPVTIKESCSVKGLSLTGCSLTRVGFKATKDGEAVRRLKEAGAIVIAVTNTPEMCLGYEANNFIKGTTRNPYDTTRTSAGSSGGEGALLGAGASLIGIGSDLGGSIRIPAMFNGVFGHKPTARIIPLAGHYPMIEIDDRIHDYLTIGPMTRYAEDLPIMMRVLTGNLATQLNLDKEVDLKQLKVLHMTDIGKSLSMIPVQEEIKHGVLKAANYLKERCGCQTSDVKFENLSKTAAMTFTLLADVGGIPNILATNPEKKDYLYIELIKTLFMRSKYTYNALFFYVLDRLKALVLPQYKYYLAMSEDLKKHFKAELGDDTVLLLPTFPTSAYHHMQSAFSAPGFTYCILFNAMGMPSTNVPVGFDSNGLPIGIQIIAAPHQDRLCIAVAQELEKCFGGWSPKF